MNKTGPYQGNGKVRGHPGHFPQVLPSFTCLIFNLRDRNIYALDQLAAWGQDQGQRHSQTGQYFHFHSKSLGIFSDFFLFFI